MSVNFTEAEPRLLEYVFARWREKKAGKAWLTSIEIGDL